MAMSMSQSPDAKSYRLQQLVSEVEQGAIKLPDFQRFFVWTETQVLDLLDSIARGYPIGSLLLWEAQHSTLRSHRNIGGFDLPERPETYPINYVLDGQQRLTTIYAVLKYSEIAISDRRVRVLYDLSAKCFISNPTEERAEYAPLSLLLDAEAMVSFLEGLTGSAGDRASEWRKSWTDLLNAFSNYLVSAVVIKQTDVNEVARIFERINSSATKLSLYDLMVAVTWSASFYLRDEVTELRTELDLKGFGSLDPVVFLQVLAAKEGDTFDTSRDSILRLRETADVADAFQTIAEASRKTADWLRADVTVMSADFLPYERQFVAIALMFLSLGRLSAQQHETLRQWFWLTSATERYRRGGEGLFSEDLRALKDCLVSAAGLDRFREPLDETVFSRSIFRRGSALTSCLVALLAKQQPRSIWDGTFIDTDRALSAFNRREFHHIFPRTFIQRTLPKAEPSFLANFCMLPATHNKLIGNRPPSHYFHQLREQLGDSFESIMESNLIDAPAIEAALADDYGAFITARARRLLASLARFAGLGRNVDPQ